MRDEYDLKAGRPNPYVAKLGARGRNDLVAWWANLRRRVRVLPEDVAEAFPDTESTVAALRAVIKLRDIGQRPRSRAAPRKSTSKRAASKARDR